jgi:zinc/manganese transport system substrate-binding protein
MRILFLTIVGMTLLSMAPSPAFAAVNVFACEPEWEALAKEIGGEYVNVTSATTAQQDVHHIRAKPSLLAAMRKADLVFCSGASLEIGWLPILIKKAGGPDVQPETIGWLMASDYVDKLEVLQKADRSMGHVHPEGNPHTHLDPRNISIVADVLAERLYLLDEGNAKAYEQNLARFQKGWKALTKKWEAEAAPLKGQKVVVYHNAWAYLLEWLGMDVIATLEPKPGIPPTASHLETVLGNVRGQKVVAILVGAYEDEDAARWLADKSGIPIARLPFTVGGNEKSDNLQGLFEETIRLLPKGKS